MLLTGYAYFYKKQNDFSISGVWDTIEELKQNEDWVMGASDVFSAIITKVTLNIPQDVINSILETEVDGEVTLIDLNA